MSQKISKQPAAERSDIQFLQVELAALKLSNDKQASKARAASSRNHDELLARLQVMEEIHAAPAEELAKLKTVHEATISELQHLKSVNQQQLRELQRIKSALKALCGVRSLSPETSPEQLASTASTTRQETPVIIISPVSSVE